MAKGFSPNQPDTLFVYDSMQFQERNWEQVLAVMSSVVRVKESFMSYVVATCQRQTSGSNDCGIFAIASATSLAFSEDPSTHLYDSVACHKHLKKCFEENETTVFPSTEKKIKRNNDLKTRAKNIAVYFHCRRTDNKYARIRASNPDSMWEMILGWGSVQKNFTACVRITRNILSLIGFADPAVNKIPIDFHFNLPLTSDIKFAAPLKHVSGMSEVKYRNILFKYRWKLYSLNECFR